MMKKALKITGITIGVILVLMLVLPLAFKGKIKQVVVDKGNEMLTARFDFRSLNVSLFRNFPMVSATLNDFYIVGKDRFEHDTLVSAGRITLAFNLKSLFGDGGYDIRRVEIDNALVHAIVLEDSTVNWNILKPTGAQADTTSASSTMRIKLKGLTIKGLRLVYDDRVEKVYASVGNLDASLSGDLSSSHSSLKLLAEATGVDYRQGAVSYLKDGKIYAKMDVDADLADNLYTLKDNTLRLNAIETKLDGWLKMPQDGMDMDLKFSSPKIDFKDMLSLIPAIYAKDFASMKATGQVSLGGWVKGVMLGDTVPAFGVDIKVSDATFRYPDLPKSVDAINITAAIKNPGGSADLTTIDINPMSFSMGGNPFSLTAKVATPVSDPAFDVAARGTIDLGMVKDVYPLEAGMSLNGVVKADASVAGRMSDVEKENYENLRAQGTVNINNMLLKSKGNPDVDIKQSTLTFSPRFLDLSQTRIVVGKNDLTLDCHLENYLAYALRDKTLRGQVNLKSSYLDVKSLMGDSPASESSDNTPMSVVEVPKNLDLVINASLAKVLYDNLTLDNVSGQIAVSGGTLDMKNLSFNTLGGGVKVAGQYSTAKSVEQPTFNGSFSMDNLSFQQSFKSLTTFQKLVPLFEKLNGNFSGNLAINTLLDKQMSPVLQSMNGKGTLSTKDLSLSDLGVISQILQQTKIGDIADRKVKDLKVDFTIADGRVRTNPFDVKLGETAMNLSGSSGLDQTLDYIGKVQLPAALAATTRLTSVSLKIGGTFTSPKVTVDMKDAATQVAQALANQALGEVGKKLGINLADAQAQKQTLVEQAQKAGQSLMDEAHKQADALTAQAKDPLTKLAAQTAANKLLAQAQKKVDDMVAKATAKGDSIISKAQ